MSFWPQAENLDGPLPPYVPMINETDTVEQERIVAYLAEFDTLFESAGEEDKWESDRFLGEGGGGRAVLWTKLDQNRNIIDVGHHLQRCAMLHY
jgi:hypothetical protein